MDTLIQRWHPEGWGLRAGAKLNNPQRYDYFDPKKIELREYKRHDFLHPDMVPAIYLEHLFNNPDQMPDEWKKDRQGISKGMTLIAIGTTFYVPAYYGLTLSWPTHFYYNVLHITENGELEKNSQNCGFDRYGYALWFK